MLIYSIILIIMMLFRPEGLFGKKEFSLITLLKGKQQALNTAPNSNGRSE